jgi:hypothetical protein
MNFNFRKLFNRGYVSPDIEGRFELTHGTSNENVKTLTKELEYLSENYHDRLFVDAGNLVDELNSLSESDKEAFITFQERIKQAELGE